MSVEQLHTMWFQQADYIKIESLPIVNKIFVQFQWPICHKTNKSSITLTMFASLISVTSNSLPWQDLVQRLASKLWLDLSQILAQGWHVLSISEQYSNSLHVLWPHCISPTFSWAWTPKTKVQRHKHANTFGPISTEIKSHLTKPKCWWCVADATGVGEVLPWNSYVYLRESHRRTQLSALFRLVVSAVFTCGMRSDRYYSGRGGPMEMLRWFMVYHWKLALWVHSNFAGRCFGRWMLVTLGFCGVVLSNWTDLAFKGTTIYGLR